VTIASRPFVGRDQIALFLFLPSRQAKFRKIRNRSGRHLIRAGSAHIDQSAKNFAEEALLPGICCEHARRLSFGRALCGAGATAQSEEQRNRSRHCPMAIVAVNDGGTVAGRLTRPLAAGPVAQWLEPAAHNGLVAGSSPAGPTSKIIGLSIWLFSTPPEIPTHSPAIQSKINKSSQWHLRQAGRALRSACRLVAKAPRSSPAHIYERTCVGNIGESEKCPKGDIGDQPPTSNHPPTLRPCFSLFSRCRR
jgi:hypothetical protein